MIDSLLFGSVVLSVTEAPRMAKPGLRIGNALNASASTPGEELLSRARQECLAHFFSKKAV
jgi:hypothetical protein